MQQFLNRLEVTVPAPVMEWGKEDVLGCGKLLELGNFSGYSADRLVYNEVFAGLRIWLATSK
jgi:hypothetical protein